MQCNSMYLVGYNNPVLLGDWDEHVAVFILIGLNANGEAPRGLHRCELVRRKRDRLLPYPRLEGARGGDTIID